MRYSQPLARLGGRAAAFTLAALLAGLACAADEFNMAVTAAGISVGNHLSGPRLVAANLVQRPVLLEFWGVHCPPCLASMPKLEQLHAELAPLGLVVIGAHAQGGPADEVVKAAASLGVTFTIVENATVKDGGDFSGIPHCMLFDHLGKCLYRGSPFDVEAAARLAVKSVPAAVLAGRTLEKLTAFNELLRNEQLFGAGLKKATTLCNSKDEATAEEAAFVVKQLTARGRQMIDDAVSRKPAEPLGAADMLQRVANSFKGDPLGTEAAKLLREWKQEPDFQAEWKAGLQLAKLMLLRAKLVTLSGSTDGTFPADKVAAILPQAKRQLTDIVASICTRFPNSKSAEAARKVAEELALSVPSVP